MSGYRAPRANPATLAAAVAINAAILGAIAMSAPQIFTAPPKPFEGYWVPADPPPEPELPPEPQPKADARPREATVTAPQPKVAIEQPSDNGVVAVDVLPPFPPPTGDPAGTGSTVSVKPAKPLPVLVDAAPDPRYARDFQPDYPASERRAGVEGAVTVRVQIAANGRVVAIERVKAASDAFFEATKRQALARWRFRPATRDGVPVDSWRTMTVRFVLEG